MSTDWLLELGHTRLKVARDDGAGGISAVEAMAPGDFEAWIGTGIHGRFRIAAVPEAGVVLQITDVLDAAGLEWHRVTTGSVALPVRASYSGMGVDRWLALQPVWRALGGAFCLVDAGSATTIDLVDQRGVHRGGWIAPGVDASREGLLARAPVLQRERHPVASLEPACDTAEAIENGLLLQQAGAIRLALEVASQTPEFGGQVPLWLTGGAAAPLQSVLGEARFEPDLVLRGLAMAVDAPEQR